MSAEPISSVYLFAGPCDSMSILAHDKQTSFKVNYSILIQGDDAYVVPVHKPGMEHQRAEYVESPEWTAALGTRTAVHASFTGRPPRQKTVA